MPRKKKKPNQKVILTLEDLPNGEIDVNVKFEPEVNAHETDSRSVYLISNFLGRWNTTLT